MEIAQTLGSNPTERVNRVVVRSVSCEFGRPSDACRHTGVADVMCGVHPCLTAVEVEEEWRRGGNIHYPIFVRLGCCLGRAAGVAALG